MAYLKDLFLGPLLFILFSNDLTLEFKNTLWPLFMDGVQLPQG